MRVAALASSTSTRLDRHSETLLRLEGAARDADSRAISAGSDLMRVREQAAAGAAAIHSLREGLLAQQAATDALSTLQVLPTGVTSLFVLLPLSFFSLSLSFSPTVSSSLVHHALISHHSPPPLPPPGRSRGRAVGGRPAGHAGEPSGPAADGGGALRQRPRDAARLRRKAGRCVPLLPSCFPLRLSPCSVSRGHPFSHGSIPYTLIPYPLSTCI